MTIDIFNPDRDKVAESITILQKYEELHEGEGYYVAFSGGKDSMVVAELCRLAGVKFDLNYNITGIDPRSKKRSHRLTAPFLFTSLGSVSCPADT